MKRKGSFFEYEEQRNAEIWENYLRLTESASGPMKQDDIYRRLVDMPASRFWVSEERAAIVIHRMLRGCTTECVFPEKRDMYREIFSRVRARMAEKPHESIYSHVFSVVNSPAPKFYMTPGTMEGLLRKIKSQWYEERKRKLRHLFM